MSFRIAALGLVLLVAPANAVPPEPIPEGPESSAVPAFIGFAARSRRIRAEAIPQHPFMAANGRSNIHDDAYQSDTYVGGGPLGHAPERASTYRQAECGSLTFDQAGRVLTICVGVEGPRLEMMDPLTL